MLRMCIASKRSKRNCIRGIEVNFLASLSDINQKEVDLVNKLINEMRIYPIKGKRTNEEFQFTTNSAKKTNDKRGLKSNYEHMLPIYESKYGGLRNQKEKEFKAKREKLPLSWLAEEYEKEEIQ